MFEEKVHQIVIMNIFIKSFYCQSLIGILLYHAQKA